MDYKELDIWFEEIKKRDKELIYHNQKQKEAQE